MNKIFAIILIASLSGCSSTRLVGIPLETPPLPSQVKFDAPVWRIINLDGVIYFGLNKMGYENLSLGIADTIRYIKEINGVVSYYLNINEELKND